MCQPEAAVSSGPGVACPRGQTQAAAGQKLYLEGMHCGLTA